MVRCSDHGGDADDDSGTAGSVTPGQRRRSMRTRQPKCDFSHYWAGFADLGIRDTMYVAIDARRSPTLVEGRDQWRKQEKIQWRRSEVEVVDDMPRKNRD